MSHEGLASMSGPEVTRSLVAHEDDDVLVAFKPVGMSVDASDRGDRSDLKAVLTGRDGCGEGEVLKPQQHLDRDTSGLVVFTKTPSAAKQMASSAGSTPILTTFLAAVRERDPRNRQSSLRSWMVKDGDRLGVRLQKVARGVEVQAELQRKERRGERALVELRTTASGRALRALLAAHGLPVAGDGDRDGHPAHRLMLHGAGVEYIHPVTGRKGGVTTAAPWDFRAWLDDRWDRFDVEAGLFSQAFTQAALVRAELAQRGLEAFRAFHGEGEGLPGVDLDRFGDYLVAWVDEQVPPEVRARVMDAAWGFGPRGVYAKVRPRAASRLGEAEREALAPGSPVRGEAAQGELTVLESGLKYLVRLGDGLATGLFLDQRGNRAWLREQVAGATVLNLFAYTCAFTVAAAAGGAQSTVSVDISARALETGRRNLQLGGLDGAQHEMVRDDVVRWVRAAQGKARRFDVIILDPPSFGSTRHGRFSAEHDYGALATECVKLLAEPEGILLACTNHRGVQLKRFRTWLRSAVEQAGRSVRGLKDVPSGVDFPAPVTGEPHMKAVRVWVGPR